MSNVQGFELKNEISTLTNNSAGHLSSELSKPLFCNTAVAGQTLTTVEPVEFATSSVANTEYFTYSGDALATVTIHKAGTYTANIKVNAAVASTAHNLTLTAVLNSVIIPGSTISDVQTGIANDEHNLQTAVTFYSPAGGVFYVDLISVTNIATISLGSSLQLTKIA